MRDADKAYIQGDNAQATVDAEIHVIVAADLGNQARDCSYLADQTEQVRYNVGRDPGELSADADYCGEANLALLAARDIEAFIPSDKVRHSEWRRQTPPRGRISRPATAKDLMRRRLRTKRGRQRYKLRQTSVEPVFGFIKPQLGNKTRTMWRFACAGVRLQPLV